MGSRKRSDKSASPLQLSLRVRHPDIDPDEISKALDLEPEHCFKAGDPRPNRAHRQVAAYTQSYWLAPLGPESTSEHNGPAFLAMLGELRSRGTEGVLLLALHRLSAHHSFLQKVQAEDGDVALILVLERESAADFTLPVALARLLVQLGISIEFNFES